ncbi:amino acid ABC transporter permease [Arenibaculum sp.]|jgi:polar amino acid transport system permease protein|uniref:amino acid ABC transporter permease n=1 Tax=Arenibaculum sp. TaxID=2865862 RepID=UPI002E12BA74|nr:amino acid ABC transporter permease [Arenibaculum sp.]
MRDAIPGDGAGRAALLAAAFAAVVAAASWIDLSGTLLGRALLPAIGSTFGTAADGTPHGARLVVGLVAAVLLAANVLAIRLLPFRLQVAVVWLELLALALAFFAGFDLSYAFIADRLPFLVFQGAAMTVYVSVVSIVLSCVVALVAALARISRSGPALAVATFYISFFRGTPLLLQIYLIYLGLPQLGLVMEAVPAGILALTLCYGAYMAEIFRAGIEGVPRGQREAAMALGLRERLVMRKVILPQAFRIVVPPIGNQFIAMLKDSSLVSVMGVWELMFVARTQGRSEFRHLEMLITAALIYWALSMVFELIQSRIEARFRVAQR